MDFTDKVVLITGASSGIGAATAILFAKLGAKLALTGRNLDSLTDVAKKCEFVGKVKPFIIKADITDENDVTNTIDCVIKHYLTIDVLVNNAGILEIGSLSESSLQQFDRVFNVNVRAMFCITKLAMPYLIESKGSIVNVSSVNGLRSFTGVIVYNMSKSAVDQFTNSLALELAQYKVRVNSVNPGVTITNLHTRAGMNPQDYEQFLERSKQSHPLGRPGNPEEVADAIVFLASNNSSFITGVNLCVDGGRHAVCPR